VKERTIRLMAALLALENTKMTDHDEELAKDLLRGAKEIARFLYGSYDQRRKVFHLAATSKLPVFKLGAMLCARKSVLLKWIEDQEHRPPSA
jgi:hypothetical protein